MTQTIRPNVDVSNNWTLVGASSAWDCINDDPDASDGDSSYIAATAWGAFCDVALTDPSPPQIGADHVVRVRHRATGPNCSIYCELTEGTTFRAGGILPCRASYQTSSIFVPPAQALAISDHSVLRLRFTALALSSGAEIRITAAAMWLPDASLTDSDVRSLTTQGVEVLARQLHPRLTRQAVEVIGSFPSEPRLTRQGIELIGKGDPAPRRLTRIGFEAVAANPVGAVGRTTRQAIEVVARASSAQRRISRHGFEALAENPEKSRRRLSRQGMEIVAKTPVSLDRRLTSVGVEVLAARTLLETAQPIPLPDVDAAIFPAQWAAGVTVETTWTTDVTSAEVSSSEERRSLAGRPWRQITARIVGFRPGELPKALAALSAQAQARFLMPLYCDVVDRVQVSQGRFLAGNFAHRRFVPGARLGIAEIVSGGRLANVSYHRIVSVSASVVEVESPGPGSPTYPEANRVFPVLDCEINLEAAARLVAAEAVEIDLVAHEVAGPSCLSPSSVDVPEGITSWKGLPVFAPRADWVAPPARGVDREGKRYGSGRAELVAASDARPRWTAELRVTALQRKDYWPLLQFFDSRRGRARAFWFVDPSATFRLVSFSTTMLTVAKDIAVHDWTAVPAVALVLRDRSVHVREVSAVVASGDTFQVTPAEPWPALAPASVARVALAHLARFASDAITERWISDEVVQVDVNVTEVLADGPVALALPETAASTSIPESIPGLTAWFDAQVNVFAQQTADTWLDAAPYPSGDYPAGKSWWTQRWVDARRTERADPLPEPFLRASSASTHGFVLLSGANAGKRTLETTRPSGASPSSFSPRLGSDPLWDPFDGLTIVWNGLLPIGLLVDLRTTAGLPVLYWDAGGAQLFAVAGFTQPHHAALHGTLPLPVPAKTPTTLMLRWSPGSPVTLYRNGALLAQSPLGLLALDSAPLDLEQCVVLRGVYSTAQAPPSDPVKEAGIGTTTYTNALLWYRRAISNAQANFLGQYLRDRYAGAWSVMS